MYAVSPASSAGRKRRVQIALSVDFDAVSGWLGTGHSTENTLSDFSSGIFAGRVGVPRLLNLFRKLGIADKVTWFLPGHSIESFPAETKAIVESGPEIGLHGYTHEGAPLLGKQQQLDIITKCISLVEDLTGKKPVGYRAPLYQLNDDTIDILESHSFLYDASLSHHDSRPYYLPHKMVFTSPDYSQPAASWMHPLIFPEGARKLIEIPGNWYVEDMTPMQFLPHIPNSHGYVEVRSIETLWKDRFEWLWENGCEGAGPTDFVFPLILHPDTSGMAHVMGMVERFLKWLMSFGEEVEFCTFAKIANDFATASAEHS